MPELDIFSILLIALGESMDCFAVTISAAIAAGGLAWPKILRTAIAFAFFQVMMTVVGWLAGQTVMDYIAAYDHWIALVLLAGIGGWMIWESFHEKEEEQKADVTKGWLLLTLAIATSIDALAIGLTFAFINVNIVLAGSVIGVVTLLITALGWLVGTRAGKLMGKRAEIVGGAILIIIGLRILVSHLAA